MTDTNSTHHVSSAEETRMLLSRDPVIWWQWERMEEAA